MFSDSLFSKLTQTAICFALLLLDIAASRPVQAEERTAQIEVQADFKPAAAVGLLIAAQETSQVLKTSIEQIAESNYIVSFKYPTDSVEYGTLASAIIVSENNQLSFGSLKMLPTSEGQPDLGPPPPCQEEEADSKYQDSMSILSRLVNKRLQRRENRLELLKRALSGAFLEKINKLERGFGLAGKSELSCELNPVELVDRLTRLHAALKTLRMEQKRLKEAARMNQ